jgi:hypothetical protein
MRKLMDAAGFTTHWDGVESFLEGRAPRAPSAAPSTAPREAPDLASFAQSVRDLAATASLAGGDDLVAHGLLSAQLPLAMRPKGFASLRKLLGAAGFDTMVIDGVSFIDLGSIRAAAAAEAEPPAAPAAAAAAVPALTDTPAAMAPPDLVNFAMRVQELLLAAAREGLSALPLGAISRSFPSPSRPGG